MSDWYMLTLIGQDRPGIVAAVTKGLFEAGCNLGETSMLRLGNNFTIMMMVSGSRLRYSAVSAPHRRRRRRAPG